MKTSTKKYFPNNIVFASGRETAYPRNARILKGLRKWSEVHLIKGAERRLTARLAITGWKLLQKSFPSDAIFFLGFYGQPLVFPTRIRWRGPLVLDAFVSTYDTYCFDRQIFNPHSLFGWIAYQIDRISCQMSDVVVVDTLAQKHYFERTFDVPLSKIHVLYVGCNEQLFSPQDVQPSKKPTVLFYSSYLPLHGVDVILHAAHLLRGESIQFILLGYGSEYQKALGIAQKLKLTNVEFRNPVPLEALPKIIAQATICLGGHFGRSDKAGRVIAGKTFQCLAMEKPTIVSDTPANNELFTDGWDALMCPRNNPAALADTIRYLLSNPKLLVSLGKRGRQTVLRTSGDEVTSRALRTIVEKSIVANQSDSPRTCS